MPIKKLKDKSGWEFAVVDGDPNAGKWCEESGRLDYDRSVEDVLPRLNAGDVVLDAGACIGPYTVPMAKKVGATGKVIAFEPSPETFECLKFNCRDLTNVELHNCALGETVHKRSIVISANVGANFLSEPCDDGNVQVVPLFLDRLNFIKMDVEGFEPFVIRGALSVIKKNKPIIFTEINHGALARYGFTKDDIIRPLTELGYTMQILDPKASLEFPQLDVFFNP